MTEHESKWAGRAAFAEAAEALGIDTDQVMATAEIEGRTSVLFTTDKVKADPMIHSATLTRNEDGVLRPGVSQPYMRWSKFMVEAGLETKLNEKFGDPADPE